MLRTSIAVAAFAGLATWAGILFPSTLPPSDRSVAALAEAFESSLEPGLELSSRGALRRDRDTFFWSLFTDVFGSNPNTPYMWNALPLLGFLLPSPMWSLGNSDAVVLLARRPPSVEYFSFTTFALFMPRLAKPALPFSSLADSFNNLNLRHTDEGLFAHVVTANARSFALVEDALMRSGLPRDAINLAVVPSDLGLFDDVGHLGAGQLRLGTHFETVLRLFRFANQTEGDAYLQAHHPVFYLRGTHGEMAPLAPSGYKERRDQRSVRELALRTDFDAHGREACARVAKALSIGVDGGGSSGTNSRQETFMTPQPVPFAPLMIRGLECLRDGTQCLGDCPDAAYFGPHISEGSDDVELVPLESDDELHLVSMVDHRATNASVYGSIAVLRPSRKWATRLSKTHMAVRATPIGVTSFEFPTQSSATAEAAVPKPFVAWAFTRNPAHCALLLGKSAEGDAPRGGQPPAERAVDGCTVVRESDVPRGTRLAYCERVYLNPTTATGPHWDDLLPAQLFQIRLPPSDAASAMSQQQQQLLQQQQQHEEEAHLTFARIRLPPPLPVAGPFHEEPLRFLHIIKSVPLRSPIHGPADRPAPAKSAPAKSATHSCGFAPHAPGQRVGRPLSTTYRRSRRRASTSRRAAHLRSPRLEAGTPSSTPLAPASPRPPPCRQRCVASTASAAPTICARATATEASGVLVEGVAFTARSYARRAHTPSRYSHTPTPRTTRPSHASRRTCRSSSPRAHCARPRRHAAPTPEASRKTGGRR